MNLDWTACNKGIADELEKHARWGAIGNAAKQVFNLGRKAFLPAAAAGGAFTLGKGLYNKYRDITGTIDGVGNAINKLAPVGLMAMLASGMRKSAPQLPTPAPRGAFDAKSLLGVNPAGVSTLTSPKVGPMNIKIANPLYDPLLWAARNRVANHVLNEVTKTSPSGAGERAKLTEENPKKIELTSKYPELAKLLEDEENKAYLNKLLA